MNDISRMPGTQKVQAHLGAGTEFEGKLTFKETVKIDGKFKGEIKADGVLIIGESAHVEAQVSVGTLQLKGTLIGNVEASKTVELYNTAKLTGDIITKELQVEKGAIFNGKCTMKDEDNAGFTQPFGTKPPEPPKFE